MILNYPIKFENREAGEVQVEKRGLYYYFSCHCELPDRRIYRVILSIGNTRQNLGICVPCEDRFTLFKRMPVKRIAGEDWVFTLHPDDTLQGSKHPVSEKSPFAMLDKLNEARLFIENGNPVIVIRDEK